jgi:mevalonate pyrophosphate decarboxylase
MRYSAIDRSRRRAAGLGTTASVLSSIARALFGAVVTGDGLTMR